MIYKKIIIIELKIKISIQLIFTCSGSALSGKDLSEVTLSDLTVSSVATQFLDKFSVVFDNK